MIHNSTDSKNLLSDFLNNNLEDSASIIQTLNLPEAIKPANNLQPTNYRGALILNTGTPVIQLNNLIQQPYIIGNEYLQEIELDSLKLIEFGNYATTALSSYPVYPSLFLHNTKLQTLNLPAFLGAAEPVPNTSVTSTDPQAAYASFRNNYWLKEVHLGRNVLTLDKEAAPTNYKGKFNGLWFTNNYSLLCLCLYYPYVLPANRALIGLKNTPIGKDDNNNSNGNGYIYVPDNLQTDYQNAEQWSQFSDKIKKLSELTSSTYRGQDTITKSWTEILSDCNSHTNLDSYNLGGTKTIILSDGIPLQMMIVGKNTANRDIVRSTGNPAVLSWMVKSMLPYMKGHTDITSNSVKNYGAIPNTHPIKQFLTDIFNKMPAELRASNTGIKEVIKHSNGYQQDQNWASDTSSYEKIWIPSVEELVDADIYRTTLGSTTSIYPYYQVVTPKFCLGETNIEAGSIIVRDYSSSSANYLDAVVYNVEHNLILEANGGYHTDAHPVYTAFGFCT